MSVNNLDEYQAIHTILLEDEEKALDWIVSLALKHKRQSFIWHKTGQSVSVDANTTVRTLEFQSRNSELRGLSYLRYLEYLEIDGNRLLLVVLPAAIQWHDHKHSNWITRKYIQLRADLDRNMRALSLFVAAFALFVSILALINS